MPPHLTQALRQTKNRKWAGDLDLQLILEAAPGWGDLAVTVRESEVNLFK